MADPSVKERGGVHEAFSIIGPGVKAKSGNLVIANHVKTIKVDQRERGKKMGREGGKCCRQFQKTLRGKERTKIKTLRVTASSE